MREIIYINKLDFITIIKKLISIFVLLGARFSLKNIREALPPLPPSKSRHWEALISREGKTDYRAQNK